MCGIAGTIHAADPTLVGRMLEVMGHRGPDGAGEHADGDVRMGACRLALLDLDHGEQPVWNETRDVCVVFNGEIYNHRELRKRLTAAGHRFSTSTDTEVLVHLYEEHGDQMCEHLHGMFAFAVHDLRRGAILIARDWLGIKPLYLALPHRNRQLILFASEIKALLQCPDVAAELDLATLADYIALGHEVGDATFITEVRCVPAGHYLWIHPRRSLPVGPPRPIPRACGEPSFVTIQEAEDLVEEALTGALKTHLNADVPVAMTLSGGLDSSLLALLAVRHGLRPKVFTVADSESHPDMRVGRSVAAHLGLEHRAVLVGWDEYLAGLPLCVTAEERPASLASVPFLLLCTSVARQFKACVHGEGADELFAGYREHADKVFRMSVAADRLRRLRRGGLAPTPHAVETIESWLAAPSGLQYTMRIRAHTLGDPLQRQHLAPVDKCAMASGLEVRVPYLDDSVVEVAASLPVSLLVDPTTSVRKYVLRRLCLRLGGMAFFDVTHRVKIGVPSAGPTLMTRFDALCRERLGADYLSRSQYGDLFDTPSDLFLFELFTESFLRRRGAPVGLDDVLPPAAHRQPVTQAVGWEDNHA